MFLSCTLSLAAVLLTGAEAAAQNVEGPGLHCAGQDEHRCRAADENVAAVWPPNIVVDAELKPFLRLMLSRSATFRRQFREISRARQLRVKVFYTSQPTACRCRASSIIQKFVDGAIHINVFLYPPRVLDPELVAHEFEHALEQAEGLDLKTFAGVRCSRVKLRADGSYETERAKRAGGKVADEFFSFRAPATEAARTTDAGGR